MFIDSLFICLETSLSRIRRILYDVTTVKCEGCVMLYLLLSSGMRHKIITAKNKFNYSVFFKEKSEQKRVLSFVVTCRF